MRTLRRARGRQPAAHTAGADVDWRATGRERLRTVLLDWDGTAATVAARAVRQRVATLVETLGAVAPGDDGLEPLITRLTAALEPLDGRRAWLLLAVLTGRIPAGDDVVAAIREAELDGVAAVLADLLGRLLDAAADDVGVDGGDGGPGPAALAEKWPTVRVVRDRVLVDVHHTATASFATGIQRVTREVTRRWVRDHEPMLVGWRPDLSALRVLTPDEVRRACQGGPPAEIPDAPPEVLVPWGCTYVLPELAAEVVRAAHLQTFGQFSGTTVNLIGYDLVPITTAETSHEGLVPGFARNLAAVRYARIVVPIANGAADEYRGWRAMLSGTGLQGPMIEAAVLPTEAPEIDPDDLAAAQRRLRCGRLPLVLVVGSHEPRKNHVAVLHAAELLWREGLRFSLTFIGGNSWNSEVFTETLVDLQDAGRPVEAITAATDELLWGGYRLARFTVFPSINEGFGLPVAESLVCGTPVITSEYGTMKEIAADGGGALLVDPRDDHSLADGMRRLLTDDELHATLSEQASTRPVHTWDDYAARTWELLVGSP